jgi:hypothetical protein
MKIEDGGAAFPITSPYNGRAGMSLRDWFAGQALVGMGIMELKAWTDKDVATAAYKYADAMIAARKDTPA